MGKNANTERYSQLITNFAVSYKPPEFVSDKVIKVIPVVNDTDVFAIYDKSEFRPVNTVRAERAPAKEVDGGWKPEAYLTEEHSLKSGYTTKQEKNAPSLAQLRRRKAELAKAGVLLRREINVFGAAGLLRTAANNVYSNNETFANLATADPRTAFNAAVNAVEAAAGKTPNTVVAAANVVRHLMSTSQYREEFKYVIDIRNEGSGGDLPSQLYGMNLVVPGALSDGANKGQAASLSRVMGDDIWIGYIAPEEEIGEEMLTFGVELMTLEEGREWFDQDVKITWVEYSRYYTLKKIATECGGLLTSVLT